MRAASRAKKTWLILAFLSVSLLITYSVAENASPQSGAKETSATQPIPLTRQYESAKGKYSIHYPENWMVDDSELGTVIISGKKDTREYFTTINIQTILSKKLGGEYGSVNDIVTDIKKQIRDESPTVTYLLDHDYELTTTGGEKLRGYEMILIYSYQGQIIEQWQIVLPRNNANIFYTWAYTAPIEEYGQVLPIAKAINQTWKID